MNRYEDYKKIMGLTSVDVGSRLAIIRAIQKIKKDRGENARGFSKMSLRQLRGIYYSL